MAYKMKRGSKPNFRDLGSSSPNPGDSPLEAWDWGSAGGGAAQGAVMGAKFGPWGAVIGGVGGAIFGGIKGGKAQEEQEALAAAQQLEDQEKDRMLAKLAVERKRKEVGYSGFSDQAGGVTDAGANQFSVNTNRQSL